MIFDQKTLEVANACDQIWILVTSVSVLNITNLSPTLFDSNIRHKHRYSPEDGDPINARKALT